jgi:hypothetical protein
LITVELSECSKKVEIILDSSGVEELKKHLLNATMQGDAHLRTPRWAGEELESELASLGSDASIIEELTIRVF